MRLSDRFALAIDRARIALGRTDATRLLKQAVRDDDPAATARALRLGAATRTSGDTALGLAIRHNRLKAALVLLDHGADPALPGEHGFNALHQALCDWQSPDPDQAQRSRPILPRLIAAMGDRIDAPGPGGRTAFAMALAAGNVFAAEALAAAGANPAIRDAHGDTPLIAAVNDIAWARMGSRHNSWWREQDAALLAAARLGCDVNATDGKGRTALHVVTAICGHDPAGDSLVDALRRAGADISLRDHDGKTAYDLAAGSLSGEAAEAEAEQAAAEEALRHDFAPGQARRARRAQRLTQSLKP